MAFRKDGFFSFIVETLTIIEDDRAGVLERAPSFGVENLHILLLPEMQGD